MTDGKKKGPLRRRQKNLAVEKTVSWKTVNISIVGSQKGAIRGE